MTEEDLADEEETPEEGEDTPDYDENDAIDEPAVTVEVSCYLVRMERDGANDDAETVPARAYLHHENDTPYYLSLSERGIIVIVSIDRTQPAFTAAEHAAAASERCQKLKEAAFGYTGDCVVNSIWSADQWRPENGLIIDNAAEALNATADWLHNLVENPIDSLFIGSGMSGPLAGAGAGVIANYVLEPITGPLEDTAKIIEVVGIVIGLATGMHPLVLACAKPLVRSEIANLFADGLNRAMSSPDARHETSPADELGKIISRAQAQRETRQARGRQGPTGGISATELWQILLTRYTVMVVILPIDLEDTGSLVMLSMLAALPSHGEA